jgi:hypothetical protein
MSNMGCKPDQGCWSSNKVAFNDKRANGTRYLEITIENRDGDLILLIVLETIEHVEQAKHVEGVGAPFARSQAALNQDAVVVVIAVHFQECGATSFRRATSPFAKLDFPEPGAPTIATTTRRDTSSSPVDRTSSSKVTFRGIVE